MILATKVHTVPPLKGEYEACMPRPSVSEIRAKYRSENSDFIPKRSRGLITHLHQATEDFSKKAEKLKEEKREENEEAEQILNSVVEENKINFISLFLKCFRP